MTSTWVLIVEDQTIIAQDIQQTLKRLGYSVAAFAASGQEALDRAAQTQPDLVLMDVNLKGEMDGVQAAEQIRARLDLPVVFLTAYADDETWQHSQATEPFGYILKPFEPKELRNAIEMALYKHEAERKLIESKETLPTDG